MIFQTARQKFLTPLALIIGLIALNVALETRPPRPLALADLKIHDAWLSLQSRREPPDSGLAVFIGLDEASLAEYGPWPWPRFILAELIQRLVNLGAEGVGLDLDLSEPDPASPLRLADDLKKYRDLDLDLAALPEDMRDYDQLLARTIAPLPVVLGARGRFDAARPAGVRPGQAQAPGRPVAHTVETAPGARRLADSLPGTSGVTWPLAGLSESAPPGLTNLDPDPDGVVRRVQLAALDGEDLHLALSLRTLLRALGRDEVTVITGPHGLEAIRAGAREIPLDPRGGLNVFFKGGGGAYPRFSAGDILAGRVPAEALKGRLAFVGASAPSLGDQRATPLDRAYPGPEIHAAIIDSLATGHFLSRPRDARAVQFLLITGAGLLGGLFFAFARPARAVAAGALMLALDICGSIHIFQTRGLYISPLPAALTIVLLAAALAWLRRAAGARRAAAVRRAWGGRVSAETAGRLARLEGRPPAAEDREATVLYANLSEVKAQAGALAAGPAAALLNQCFTALAGSIQAGQGTVGSWTGESLTAFWNAPLPLAGHPEAAVRTALNLQKALADLRRNSGPPLAAGFGLDTGPARLARLGPPGAESPGLIGGPADLSVRLEAFGRFYGAGVAVSGAVRRLCGDEAFAFQPLDVLRLEGLEQPLAVFAPLPPEEAGARAAELARYREAFEFYRGGDFIKALLVLGGLAARHPETALYGLLKKRCETLAAEPPDSWDGVWTPPRPALL